MVAPNDIADAIEQLIQAEFPGESVHRDLCPSGFTRPCSLLTIKSYQIDPNLAHRLAQVECAVEITTFVEVDEYHQSHLAELHRRQMILAGIFMPGTVRIGSRYPEVVSIDFGGGFDFDTVTATIRFAADKTAFLPADSAPTAEHINIHGKRSDNIGTS